MKELAGKVVLVTGASKGIGAAIASKYAAAGATIIVNYSSSESAANEVVAQIRNDEGEAVAIKADFSKEAEIDQCFASIKDRYSKLDILINNAGVFKFNMLDALSSTEFYRHFDLNVLGTLLAIKHAVALMPKEGGSILNITSIVSTMAPARSTVYAASKGAIEAATTALSKELGSKGIRVNSLAPGGVETEGTSGSLHTDVFREFKERTPLGRLGLPDDIANIALFLGSPAAFWVNGQHIVAAGGMTI